MIEYLNALPPWPGSNRRVTAEVMMALAKAGAPPGTILADPFAGSCSVAMSAKALGYRVRANDASVICEATGKAMIANGHRKLSPEERDLALTGAYGEELIRKSKSLGLLKTGRVMLGKIVAAERAAESEQLRTLYRAWLVKCVLTMVWWDAPNTDVDTTDADELTVGQAAKVGQLGRPLRLALKLADQMNAGIFDNAYENTMNRLQAPEFLTGIEADAAYLDPPYLGAQSRNPVYVGLAELLEPDSPVDMGRREKGADWELLTETIEAADHIGLLVVSLGGVAETEAVAEAVEGRGREAQYWSLRRHELIKAKEARAERDEELLLVAPKKNKRSH